MPIEQLKVGFDNFSYVIYSPARRKAALVDPGVDATAALQFLSTKDLILEYLIATHHHQDHTGACARIKRTRSLCRMVASAEDGSHLEIPTDLVVADGSVLHVGDVTVKVLLTPGHTEGGICLLVDGKALITGDTLFIGDCGRTDLPGGSPQVMFDTLRKKLMALPDDLVVYPGHDYGPAPSDTLGNQKRTNKCLLASTYQEFTAIP